MNTGQNNANNTNGGNNAGSDISDLMDDNDLGTQNNGNTSGNSQNVSNQQNQQQAAADTNTNASNTTNTTNQQQTAPSDNKADNNANQQTTAPEAVEIDGQTYKLDKDGNALGQDGKIVKTKLEIEALVSADEVPLVDEILQKSGLKIVGEDGKPKTYEDTPDGLLTLANDIANEKAKAIYKKQIEKHPALTDFAKHLERGGDPTDYFTKQATSWTNFKFDNKNDDHNFNVVVAELVSKGIPKEQAELTAKMYKDTDKLTEMGKGSYGRLTAEEKAIAQQADQIAATKEAQEQEKVDNHWKSVNAVVKKGTLHNITIPETERDEFFSYIAFDADGKGNSKAVIDRSKLPMELSLQLDYLQFKGFDVSKLIQNAVKQQQVITLRKRTAQKQSGVGGGDGINKGQHSKPDDVDVSMDNLQM